MEDFELVETDFYVPLLWHRVAMHNDGTAFDATCVDTLLDSFHTSEDAVYKLGRTAFKLQEHPPLTADDLDVIDADRQIARSKCITPIAIQRFVAPIPAKRQPGQKIAVTVVYDGNPSPIDAAYSFRVVDARYVGKDRGVNEAATTLAAQMQKSHPGSVIVNRTTANSFMRTIIRAGDPLEILGAVCVCWVFQPPEVHPLELLARQSEI